MCRSKKFTELLRANIFHFPRYSWAGTFSIIQTIKVFNLHFYLRKTNEEVEKIKYAKSGSLYQMLGHWTLLWINPFHFVNSTGKFWIAPKETNLEEVVMSESRTVTIFSDSKCQAVLIWLNVRSRKFKIFWCNCLRKKILKISSYKNTAWNLEWKIRIKKISSKTEKKWRILIKYGEWNGFPFMELILFTIRAPIMDYSEHGNY